MLGIGAAFQGISRDTLVRICTSRWTRFYPRPISKVLLVTGSFSPRFSTSLYQNQGDTEFSALARLTQRNKHFSL